MKRMRLPSPAMFVACVALTVALGGTGYAAVKLPRNSVGAKQLKKNAVTAPKVKNNSLTGADVRESTFARVPSATEATTADSADTLVVQGTDASNLVAGYATIVAQATPAVRHFGGKRVSSVAVTRVGAGEYNVTFGGTFPGVTSNDNVFVLTGTWDSDNFHETEASMDQSSSSATSITVRVFTWRNDVQPPVLEDADFSVMLMTP